MLKKHKLNLNNENGITLIALVVTIVIILILAGVTIAIAIGDGGLIQSAKDAKNAQELDNYKARIEILVSNWEIRRTMDESLTINDLWQSLVNEGIINSTSDPDVTTNADGDYVIKTPAGEIIIENDEDITIGGGDSSGGTTGGDSGSGGTDSGDSGGSGDTGSGDTSGDVTTGEGLKEGVYVYYTDNNGNQIKCNVLYEASSEYGLQLLPVETLENIAIITTDVVETAKEEYNNAITKLNNKAKEYINTNLAYDARCVGTNPLIPNSQNGPDINGMYNEDDNYVTDIQQMEKLGIMTSSNSYWVGSRHSDSATGYYYLRFVSYDSTQAKWILSDDYLLLFYGTYGWMTEVAGLTLGFRPVFSINEGVKIVSGEGTNLKPYVIE